MAHVLIKRLSLVIAVFTVAYVSASASVAAAATPTTLVNFDKNNGANPQAGLVADAAGNLCGTTFNGGSTTMARCSRSPRPAPASRARRRL
jgi:hypothetical protein